MRLTRDGLVYQIPREVEVTSNPLTGEQWLDQALASDTPPAPVARALADGRIVHLEFVEEPAVPAVEA